MPSPPTNSPPHAVLELTEEEFTFLLGNCESNIMFGLNSLQVIEDRSTAERMVEVIEQFKNLKKKLERSKL